MSYSYNTNYKPKTGKGNPCKLPLDCSYILPWNCKVWLESMSITLDLVHKYQIQWSEGFDGGRLIIPNYSDDGKLLSYQGRGFTEEDNKYTGRGRKGIFSSKGQGVDLIPGMCVIVEDAMSCIKVGELQKCIALQGNTIKDEDIINLALQYDWFLVWLDDDSGGEHGVSNILPRLRKYRYAGAVATDRDPKYHTYDEIRDILNAFQRSS